MRNHTSTKMAPPSSSGRVIGRPARMRLIRSTNHICLPLSTCRPTHADGTARPRGHNALNMSVDMCRKISFILFAPILLAVVTRPDRFEWLLNFFASRAIPTMPRLMTSQYVRPAILPRRASGPQRAVAPTKVDRSAASRLESQLRCDPQADAGKIRSDGSRPSLHWLRRTPVQTGFA